MSENPDELQQRTIKVFESARKHGLKLNISKCQFNQSEIIFLGHKITAEGIDPDHNKVEAIQKMPYPSDVKGFQRFFRYRKLFSKIYTKFIKSYRAFA